MPLHNLAYLALLTLLPFFELRLSIPAGIAMGEPATVVFAVCVLTNILLGPVVYLCLDRFIHLFLRFPAIEALYNRIVRRTRRRAEPLVQRYGLLGIALFVAVPLPGSGSYTGALAAYLLGLGHRKFAIANTVGVLIAGTIVTLLALGFFTGIGFM